MQSKACATLALLFVLTLGCSASESDVVGGDAGTAPTPEATSSPAGDMEIEVLVEGEGRSPSATDTVRVHYHGTFQDGRVFDSSVDRGKPAAFPLNRVIPCWTQAVQTMKEGGKIRVTCPPNLAYGERGAGPIPPNSTLIFEVELLGIE
ncbi:MAG: FKBP-type peptidyl-prolyl cis-trans isomerase [Deltaproteobacteria bacterium]|nr:FKBP-type peptidyl-prolyl cis-trans isomerase [Deltaproteobacteria bacterium]MBW2395904.1 FKBP-type peptidyl-prolyl cis-trans isomerase [Deltaproteobacteria bacterium]